MPMQIRTLSPIFAMALSLAGADGIVGQSAIEAFAFLRGSWEGELVYLDYGDDSTLVRLPMSLVCSAGADGASLDLTFAFVEPDGRVERSAETLRATGDGVRLGDLWRVAEEAREVSPGVFRVVLEREGEDNGLAARIVDSIVLDGDDLTITSVVTYRESGDSLRRHQYRLHRSERGPLAGVLLAPRHRQDRAPRILQEEQG
jgi:hypothetical protein